MVVAVEEVELEDEEVGVTVHEDIDTVFAHDWLLDIGLALEVTQPTDILPSSGQ